MKSKQRLSGAVNMTKPIIELQKYKVSNAERYLEILNSIDGKYGFQSIPKDVEEEKRFLKKLIKRINSGKAWGFSVIFNNQIVGGTGGKINANETHVVEAGYFIDSAFQGKGIATAAFEQLTKIIFKSTKIKRIEALIFSGNTASLRVVQKVGFTHEGTLRKYIKFRNRYHDVEIYAKIR
jgi:RimJ/RimL family protein N-acetyltransferase